jgi:hypothetical protein
MHDTRWWRALAALAFGVLAVIAYSGDTMGCERSSGLPEA